MFILVGTRRTSQFLGQVPHPCARCQTQTLFRYMRQSEWFTLFFIPIIPMGKTTHATCTGCRMNVIVNNAVADQTLAQARMMAAPPMPQAAYGQPPPPPAGGYGYGYGPPR